MNDWVDPAYNYSINNEELLNVNDNITLVM